MTIHGIECEPLTEEQQAQIREVLTQPFDAALGSKRRGGLIPPPASRASVSELRAEVQHLREQLELTQARLEATMETVRELGERLEKVETKADILLVPAIRLGD